jgi:hypothetical protein
MFILLLLIIILIILLWPRKKPRLPLTNVTFIPSKRISPRKYSIYKRISRDYSLSGDECRGLFDTLFYLPEAISETEVLHRLGSAPYLSDYKRFLVVSALPSNNESMLILDALGQRTLDEETRVNVRDYLYRQQPHTDVINYFESNEPAPVSLPAEQLLPSEIEAQAELLAIYERRMKSRTKTRPPPIYEKAENVHDSGINKSMVNAGRLLIDTYGSELPSGFNCQVLREYSKDWAKVSKACDRILVKDTSSYGYGNYPYTLKDVFAALINFIYSRPAEEQKTLFGILASELESKSTKCGTGHLYAVVGTAQGFQNFSKITMNIDTEIYARVSKFLSTELEAAPESVIESVSSADKSEFVDFVRARQTKLLNELQQEYKSAGVSQADVEKELAAALNKYTMTASFS